MDLFERWSVPPTKSHLTAPAGGASVAGRTDTNNGEPLEMFLAAMRDHASRHGKRPPYRSGKGYIACCPAHDDSRASLSISTGDDGAVIAHCFAGCTVEAVAGALGLTVADLFPRRDSAFSFVVVSPRKRGKHSFVVTPATVAKADGKPLADDAKPSPFDWVTMANQFIAEISRKDLAWLAENLGVSESALGDVWVGFATARNLRDHADRLRDANLIDDEHRRRLRAAAADCFTFPECDASHKIIGIATRRFDGSKGFFKGGRRGLIVPCNFAAKPDPVLIVEGPTDTAAVLTVNLAAVGRPNAAGGADLLADLLVNREVIVVGDNDRKPDGSWPGRVGAESVAKSLAEKWGRPVDVRMPFAGVKDIREWLKQQAQQTGEPNA